ncbi:hypothetical protein ACVWZA_003862 [Sphingomonas sp. UYAg733]
MMYDFLTNSGRQLARMAIPVALLGVAILGGCSQSNAMDDVRPSPTASAPAFSSTVPTDIANPADPQQAALFAWQEFIALTWPAKTNPAVPSSGYFRGQPSPTDMSGTTGPGGVTVWETFYHRNELYPTYASGGGNILPDPNAAPAYQYGAATTIAKATPQTSLTLFNNLDEASEITLANMYHTPFAVAAEALSKSFPNPTPAQQQQILDAQTKASLVYEAKGNPLIFNYLKATQFNNAATRRKAKAQAINKITNMPVTGTPFELPSGAIEIKATWRRYDSKLDNLNAFHWTKGIYYTKTASGGLVANNDILLLIALHIIQKTPNVPTFTFATFEHVSNEANGFRFINTNPQVAGPAGYPRALPDPGMITAARQFPIPGAGSPFNLVAYNQTMQAQVRSMFGATNVWANYQLIGVQAVVQNDPGGAVPAQTFFLSNFATETNDTLQFFQGGLGGPSQNVPGPNTAHVAKLQGGKYVGFTAGGCLGCHGSQGQFQGGDFSVIAATGNAFIPEPVRPYPGGPVVAQNPAGFPLPH